MRYFLPLLTLAVAVTSASVAATPVGPEFSFQGRLTDTDGKPIDDITLGAMFELFDAAVDGASLGTQTKNITPADGGFTVELNEFSQFGVNPFNGDARWLEITIDGDKLSPRIKLTATPYAQFANQVPWTGVTGVPGGGFWQLAGNAGTDPTINYVGTSDVQPLELRTNNRRGLELTYHETPSDFDPTYAQKSINTVGGQWRNSIADGVHAGTIAGGGFTDFDCDGEDGNGNQFCVYVEYPNTVLSSGATIGGGYGNQAGYEDPDRFVGAFATVAGGRDNRASGRGAAIPGGSGNLASGSSSFAAGSSSVATGDCAIAVGLGSGAFATGAVALGYHVSAGGDASFAGGYGARVRDKGQVGGGDTDGDQGAFVWSDRSSYDDFVSTGPNQFLIRATGGVGINTNSPASPLTVNGLIETRTDGGGIKFPDGTVQKTAATSGSPAWDLTGNAGTDPANNFIGTTDEVPFEIRVNNGRMARFELDRNLLLGDDTNRVGTNPKGLDIAAATIGGGADNEVRAAWTTIGGGLQNVAGGGDDLFGGLLATVGGGQQNQALGATSTVSGGRNNQASGEDATIGGGRENWAREKGTAVCGGYHNRAFANHSTIAGGYVNTTRGDYATVGGGQSNDAWGFASVVLGGTQNLAGGHLSLAAGHRAVVRAPNGSGDEDGDEGTFVWSDYSIDSDFASGGPNQFLIRSAGGVGINTNAPTHQLTVIADSKLFDDQVARFRNPREESTTRVSIDSTYGGELQFQQDGATTWSLATTNSGKEFQIRRGGDKYDDWYLKVNTDGDADLRGGLLVRGDASADTLDLGPGTDASLDGGGAFQIGGSNTTNIVMDDNEIMARNNGAATVLALQAEGGNLVIGNSATGGRVGINTSSPAYDLHVRGLSDDGVGTIFVSPPASDSNSELRLAETPGGSYGSIIRHNGSANQLEVFGIVNGADAGPHLTIARNSGNASFAANLGVTGDVAIGVTTAEAALHVVAAEKSGGPPVAIFDRTTSDGALVQFRQDGALEGAISVSGNTVSYGAFTGVHYAHTDEVLERGTLVRFTGDNWTLGGRPESEVLYGIVPTASANDPACLGAYLALSEPDRPASNQNPQLIMADGNGDLWVVDTGRDIEPGDKLISSDATGCAMLDDPLRFSTGHVVARAAEQVEWSSVAADSSGVKRARISVLFDRFTRTRDDSKRVEQLERRIAELEQQSRADRASLAELVATVRRLAARQEADPPRTR